MPGSLTCFWHQSTFLHHLPSTPSDTTTPGVPRRSISKVGVHNREVTTSPTFRKSGFGLRLCIYWPACWRKPQTSATYGKLHITIFLVSIMIPYFPRSCAEIQIVDEISIVFLRRCKMLTSSICGSDLCDRGVGNVVLPIQSSIRTFRKYKHVAGSQQRGHRQDNLQRLLKIMHFRFQNIIYHGKLRG